MLGIGLFACDDTLSPAQARAIVGSSDWCKDRENIIIGRNGSDLLTINKAKFEFSNNCLPNPGGKKEKPEISDPE